MKSKISAGTIVRTIGALVVAANIILPSLGIDPIPFNEEEVGHVVESIISGVLIIWAWWKNNSFTQKAIKADEQLKK